VGEGGGGGRGGGEGEEEGVRRDATAAVWDTGRRAERDGVSDARVESRCTRITAAVVTAASIKWSLTICIYIYIYIYIYISKPETRNQDHRCVFLNKGLNLTKLK